MINEPTKDILKAMRCTAMADEFEKQLKDPNTYGTLVPYPEQSYPVHTAFQ